LAAEVRRLCLFLVCALAVLVGCEQKSAFELTDEGLALVRAGKSSAALRRFEAAIQADPDYPFGYYYAAGLYNERRDWERAERYLARTIELRPDYANAYYTLGFVLENRAKHLLMAGLQGEERQAVADLAGEAFLGYAESHLPAADEARQRLEGLLRRSREAYARAARQGLPLP
jgi:tetratricopeptide (TPR) repeat protein